MFRVDDLEKHLAPVIVEHDLNRSVPEQRPVAYPCLDILRPKRVSPDAGDAEPERVGRTFPDDRDRRRGLHPIAGPVIPRSAVDVSCVELDDPIDRIEDVPDMSVQAERLPVLGRPSVHVPERRVLVQAPS